MSTHHFEFPQSTATGYQLELLLRQYGIPVLNRYAGNGRISFDVPSSQAKWAAYIFRRAGVLSAGDAAAEYDQRPLPVACGVGTRRRDLTTLWVDFLGAILGAPRRKTWQAKTKGQRR